jgi:hypothetical protein
MMDFRVYKSHKNKITNKQVMKRRVCNSVQRRAHASRATVWKDDKIFKINIYNNRNGCALIKSSPIVKRPKTFQ